MTSSLYALSTHQRWDAIAKYSPHTKEAKNELYDSRTQEHESRNTFSKNIENFIGTVKVPIGLAGPLKVKNSQANREYFVPIATTEAALVASVNRGCKLLNLAGGAVSRVVDQRIQRAPAFEFCSLDKAIKFEQWISSPEVFSKFEEITSTTTRHGKFIKCKPFIQGNRVTVKFEFYTAEAMGQNMVSISTQQIVNFIRKQDPEGMVFSVIEGGHASDKSGTVDVLQHTRGRKVITECIIKKEILEKNMKVSPLAIYKTRQIVANSQLASGQVGTLTGNATNILAGMYIACGQDAACVAEGQIGLSRFDLTEKGDLYCCMTLPGLVVGLIGGGAALPSQRAGLSILDCKTSNEFAEVVGAVCLAAELSLVAAITSDDFANAHEKFARAKL